MGRHDHLPSHGTQGTGPTYPPTEGRFASIRQGEAELPKAGASWGLVALTGCSALTPSSKTQSIEVCAIGIPGIAIITSTSQSATYDGGDTNAVIQANPADVTVPVTLGK